VEVRAACTADLARLQSELARLEARTSGRGESSLSAPLWGAPPLAELRPSAPPRRSREGDLFARLSGETTSQHERPRRAPIPEPCGAIGFEELDDVLGLLAARGEASRLRG